MHRSLRFLSAIVASALVPTIVVGAILAFFVGEDGWFEWFTTTVGITFGLALLHLIVLGLPAIAWLRRTARFRPGPMAIAGAIIAMIPVGILTFPLAPWADNTDTWGDWVEAMVVFAPIGALSGLAFYAVAREKVPAPQTA